MEEPSVRKNAPVLERGVVGVSGTVLAPSSGHEGCNSDRANARVMGAVFFGPKDGGVHEIRMCRFSGSHGSAVLHEQNPWFTT